MIPSCVRSIHSVLPDEGPFVLQDPVYFQHEVYKHALIMAADVQTRLQVGCVMGHQTLISHFVADWHYKRQI